MIELLQTVGDLQPGCYGHLGGDEEARLICAGLARSVAGEVLQLSPAQLHGLRTGRLVRPDGVSVLQTATNRAKVSRSGVCHWGVGLLVTFECTVAAGTIKIYDSLTASGTVLLDEMDLAVGALDLASGSNMGARFATACYVALSNPSARVELIFGRP